MNKTIMGIILAIVIVGGGVTAVVMNNDSDTKSNESSQSADVMEKKDSEAMEKKDEAVMEKKESESMEKTDEGAMMKKTETYVTLSDYESSKDAYSDQKKVYFFHASWCVICQGIDKEITGDPSQIPTGTTFIKTDFDSNTELRKKYGVTSQYTFVQVDNEGNEVAQWSATSLDKAIAGIKS